MNRDGSTTSHYVCFLQQLLVQAIEDTLLFKVGLYTWQSYYEIVLMQKAIYEIWLAWSLRDLIMFKAMRLSVERLHRTYALYRRTASTQPDRCHKMSRTSPRHCSFAYRMRRPCQLIWSQKQYMTGEGEKNDLDIYCHIKRQRAWFPLRSL